MDALPLGVLQDILSHLSNARDVASCAAVARSWRDCRPFLPSLYFLQDAFDTVAAADDAIGRMVGAAARLEKLVVHCSFSASLLPRWVAARAATLRVLELGLTLDLADEPGILDSIGVAAGLEVLRLRGCIMVARTPAWGIMERLRVLEVECFLLKIATVNGTHRLKRLKISNKDTNTVLYHVDMGKLPLPELDHLVLLGKSWTWDAIRSVLQCAAEVKQLVIKVESCADYDTLQPSPEIEFTEFINSHPKLRKLQIHGAMFALLCQKNSLNKLDSRFVRRVMEKGLDLQVHPA